MAIEVGISVINSGKLWRFVFGRHFFGGHTVERRHAVYGQYAAVQKLKGSMKELNILIYFFFPPITQSCSVSDVLFTGGRGVSDFSVLEYY